MKKRQNKYIVINDLQANLPEICESEIIPQDKFVLVITYSLVKKSKMDTKFISSLIDKNTPKQYQLKS